MKKYIFTTVTFGIIGMVFLATTRKSTANAKPTPQSDTITLTPLDCGAWFNLLKNDSDPDGDALKITKYTFNGSSYGITAAPRALQDGAELQLNSDGSGFVRTGSDFTIEYTVSDGHRGTNTATAVFISPQLPPNTVNGWVHNLYTFSNVVLTYYTNTTGTDTLTHSALGEVWVKDGLLKYTPLIGRKGTEVVYLQGWKFIIEVR